MMDIEKIEQILESMGIGILPSSEISTADLFPLIQCKLLLHIYKKLESIDNSLASMSTDSWNDHHNH